MHASARGLGVRDYEMAEARAMTRPRRATDLTAGGRYRLPDGQQVWATRALSGGTWLLHAVDGRRVYVVDPADAIRLIQVADATGVPQRVPGVEGYGVPTSFTVRDLRPVGDG